MDYKKLANVLVEEGNTVRVASNNSHTITLIHEDAGDAGEYLVLWVGDDVHVWQLGMYSPQFNQLRAALLLSECGIASEVWPATEHEEDETDYRNIRLQ